MPRLAPVTLVGRHVRLAPLGYEHGDALLAAANEKRSHYGFTIVPDSRESMNTYLRVAFSEQEAGTSLPFVVLDSGGSPIGTTRYMNIQSFTWPGPPPEPLPKGPDVLEIGSTWYAERVQRTGVNTEAKLLLLTYAFETLGVRGVILNTDARNVRSRTAIERIGAKLDGVLRVHRASSDGTIVRDTARFSMTADEWPAARERLNAFRLPR